METKNIDSIIICYLNGTIDAIEEKTLHNWLEEDKAHQKYFMEIRDVWLFSQVPTKLNSSDQGFAQFKKRINKKKMSLHHSYVYRWMQWSASIAALFILCIGTFYLFNRPSKELVTEIPKVYYKVLMPKNCKGSFVLPDSSVVWLNSGSTLIYPEKFETNCRNVRLIGEGYFEVKRNTVAPFYVEAKDMLITVLGTTFTVRSYENDDIVETVLLSGSVNVKIEGSKTYLLKPNQKIALNVKDKHISVTQVVACDYNIWKEDCLSFDNALLGEVINKLEKWYGAKITCNDNLKRKIRLSLTVRNESLSEILKMISLIAPIRYKVDENQKAHIYDK